MLGFGHIGREIARILRALGAHVIGVSRTGAPDTGADEMQPIAKLDDVLRRADAIMIALPLDPATHHLINARDARAVQEATRSSSTSRAAALSTRSRSTEALKNGTIAGAGLDVTDPEPLPPEHPLWDAPNLYHLAALRRRGRPRHDRPDRRAAADNLMRFKRGEALKNVVKV